jgi:DNA-binding NtrC family response regulator
MEGASIELRRPIRAITPEAIDCSRRHDWPGNVRELRNVVRQAVLQTKGLIVRSDAVRAVLGEAQRAVAVAALPRPGQSLREIAAQPPQRPSAGHRETLQATAGNKSQAAGVETDYKTLHLEDEASGNPRARLRP